jgi:hypothetical protein
MHDSHTHTSSCRRRHASLMRPDFIFGMSCTTDEIRLPLGGRDESCSKDTDAFRFGDGRADWAAIIYPTSGGPGRLGIDQ